MRNAHPRLAAPAARDPMADAAEHSQMCTKQ
jgi:hypothetical protein